MAPLFLAAEILQLAELHLAVLGRLSQTFKEWTMEWLFQWPKTQESDYWPVTKIMSNLATHLTKLESVIVSTLRRPASLCDKSCCDGVPISTLISQPMSIFSLPIFKLPAPMIDFDFKSLLLVSHYISKFFPCTRFASNTEMFLLKRN